MKPQHYTSVVNTTNTNKQLNNSAIIFKNQPPPQFHFSITANVQKEYKLYHTFSQRKKSLYPHFSQLPLRAVDTVPRQFHFWGGGEALAFSFAGHDEGEVRLVFVDTFRHFKPDIVVLDIRLDLKAGRGRYSMENFHSFLETS